MSAPSWMRRLRTWLAGLLFVAAGKLDRSYDVLLDDAPPRVREPQPLPWIWELRQGDAVLSRYYVHPLLPEAPIAPTMLLHEMPSGEVQWFLDRGDGFAPHGEVFSYFEASRPR